MASEIELPSINQINTSQTATSQEKIVVCRGRSCRKYQAEKVFDKFQENLPSDIELMSVPCLGQCGNGPMVVIEPESTWYYQVHSDEVETVIQQHIVGKSPVQAMLYPKFHK